VKADERAANSQGLTSTPTLFVQGPKGQAANHRRSRDLAKQIPGLNLERWQTDRTD
jgi:hypothetical protein